MKKKVLALLLVIALAVSFAACGQKEDEKGNEEAEGTKVYVTISNAGVCEIPMQVFAVPANEDGTLTIKDVLTAVHEAECKDGFVYDENGYITKLWGVENGGAYGYYLNNEMAYSLDQAVSEGDYLKAYVFADTTYWSDVYTYFDANFVEGAEVTLTLNAISFDENWNTVVVPLEGAVITIDGVDTEYVTDANGQVTLKGSTAGTYIVSATSATATLVPPVAVWTVK